MKYVDMVTGKAAEEISGLEADFKAGSKYKALTIGRENIFFKKLMKTEYISLCEVNRVFRRVRPVDAGCCPPLTIEEQYLVAVGRDGREYEMHVGDDRHGEVDIRKILEEIKNIGGIEMGFVKDGQRDKN